MNAINEKYLMKVATRPDVVMVRGQGSYLWDDTGRRYLDFVQGWAVNALGHAPSEIAEALAKQASILLTPSPAYHNGPQIRLAERLCTLTGLDEVHFSSSGAEANEVAVKLARKWGRLNKRGAFEVVTTHNGFHGRTLAMMAASGKPGWSDLFPPNPPGFRHVAFGDAAAMSEAITEKTAAIMVEPIQGEAGVIVPTMGYLRQLRGMADEANVLLILDEVQTGLGRTGRLFAFEHEEVKPDILTLGKGLGGGFPISATLARTRASCLELGDQGGTFNGNPLGACVANAVLDTVLDDEFLVAVRDNGRHLVDRLQHSAREFGFRDVRGMGLLVAIELSSALATNVRDAAFERGLLINAARPTILRFMPSLRVSHAEIDEAVARLHESLASVRAAA